MSDKPLEEEVAVENLYLEVYRSYVDRLHSFRQQQHTIIVILTGLFTLTAKALIDLNDAKGQIENGLYVAVTVASAFLCVLFLNHAYIVLLFARLLRNIERRLDLPLDIQFYSRHGLGRGISYFTSLFLPFSLYICINTFFVFVSDIPPWYYWIGIGVHVALFGFSYWILLKVRKQQD